MFKILMSSLLLVCATGLAEAQSSKAAAKAGEVMAIPHDGEFHTIFSTDIRTAQVKDLFMQVNLECALTTETTVADALDPGSDTSNAEAEVQVQILVDGVRVAEPGPVTFCKREQEQEAMFGGIINSCSDDNGDGNIDVMTECDVDDETLRLLINTMTANSFGFILDNLGAKRHTIEVQAGISTNTEFEDGSARADAFIGHGSITVEEVRLENDAEIRF